MYVWCMHANHMIIDKHSETRRQHLPDAAAVLCLQGKLWQAHKDLTQAVECYAEALKLNPFMWDAFLGLCEAGEFDASFAKACRGGNMLIRIIRCQHSSAKYISIKSRVGRYATSRTSTRSNCTFRQNYGVEWPFTSPLECEFQ